MQRIVLPCLACTLFSFSAFASPLDLTPAPAPAPSAAGAISSVFATAPEPAPVRVAQGPNMGGGFIEMLFRNPGGQQGAYQPAPQYSPQYAPEPPPGPRYYGPGSRADDGDGYQSPRASLQPADPRQAAPNPRFARQEVNYDGKEKPGTIIINTRERLLYLVKEGGRATRYGIGVGRPGFTWAGTHHISNKREWPDWRPPAEMLRRQPHLPRHMVGGPDNPLGARAMYLGSTLYRIHGSNEPWTIGTAVSSGCIRMRNEDVIHLYDQVRVGTRVIVI
jgi:lipoprotein-anchoring transpeptidase ErfK/SrfK